MFKTFGPIGAIVFSLAAAVTVAAPGRGDVVSGSPSRTGAGWSRPARVGTGPSADGLTSVVASANGDITVLWDKAHGMVSRTKRAGRGWAPPVRLRGWAPALLDSDAHGNLTALYAKAIPGSRRVEMTATKPRGGVWSLPRRISPIPGRRGCNILPEVEDLAVSPHGAAVAGWVLTSEDCAVPQRVQVAYRPAGGSWRPFVTLARGAWLDGVAIGPRGRPLVLLDGKTLRAVQRTAHGWRQAGGDIAGEVWDSAIAEGLSGRSVVVWEREVTHGTTTTLDILGTRWVGGGWTTPVLLGSEQRVGDLTVGVDARGTATVLWSYGNSGVRAVRWRVGHRPAQPQTLVTHNGWGPVLRVAPRGTVTVLLAPLYDRWKTRLAAITRPAQGTWSAPRPVSRRPRVADESQWIDVLPSGRAFVTWMDDRDSGPAAVRVSWTR